ncbi:MAG: hypothetical protein ACLU2J_04300 [Clostridia bacterium]|jgi:hypothetical protein
MAIFIHNIDEAEDDVLEEFGKEFQKKTRLSMQKMIKIYLIRLQTKEDCILQ